jgi:hypothetical protein
MKKKPVQSDFQQIASDIEGVLKKHSVDPLYYPHCLGGVLDALREQCLGNSVPWFLEGLFSSYAIRTQAADTVKQLVELLDARGKQLNYNDLDCDLRGKKFKIVNECLECSSLVAKLGALGKAPKPEDCPRCKGTKLDPEFFDYAWVLGFDNHGHHTFFIVQENSSYSRLHVRRLPYNMARGEVKKHFELFCAAAQTDRYDSEYEYMRYWDRRDKGFRFSMTVGKEDLSVSDCEVNTDAVIDLQTIVEHFPTVIAEFEQLVKEDTISDKREQSA